MNLEQLFRLVDRQPFSLRQIINILYLKTYDEHSVLLYLLRLKTFAKISLEFEWYVSGTTVSNNKLRKIIQA